MNFFQLKDQEEQQTASTQPKPYKAKPQLRNTRYAVMRRRQHILEGVKRKPMTLSEICRNYGYTTATGAYQLLKQMVDDGELVRNGNYYLVPGGKEVSTDKPAAATVPQPKASKPEDTVDPKLTATIENLAKEYVWATDAKDLSLKGFVTYVKENGHGKN